MLLMQRIRLPPLAFSISFSKLFVRPVMSQFGSCCCMSSGSCSLPAVAAWGMGTAGGPGPLFGVAVPPVGCPRQGWGTRGCRRSTHGPCAAGSGRWVPWQLAGEVSSEHGLDGLGQESVAGWAWGRLGLHPDGPRRNPKPPAGEGWHLPALRMLPWPQSGTRSCASPRHRPCWSPSMRKVNPTAAPAPQGDQRVPPKHPHGVTGPPNVTAPMEIGNPCLNQQPLYQPCPLGDSSAPQRRLLCSGLGWFGDFLGVSSTMLSTPRLLVPKMGASHLWLWLCSLLLHRGLGILAPALVML